MKGRDYKQEVILFNRGCWYLRVTRSVDGGSQLLVAPVHSSANAHPTAPLNLIRLICLLFYFLFFIPFPSSSWPLAYAAWTLHFHTCSIRPPSSCLPGHTECLDVHYSILILVTMRLRRHFTLHIPFYLRDSCGREDLVIWPFSCLLVNILTRSKQPGFR